MFYDVEKQNHGLPLDPFKAIVTPRPIGWVTTVDAQGRINLAPFSFFNGVSDAPPMVMYCPGGSFEYSERWGVKTMPAWAEPASMATPSATTRAKAVMACTPCS